MGPSAFGPGWWSLGRVPRRGGHRRRASNYVGPDALQLIIDPGRGGAGRPRPDLDIERRTGRRGRRRCCAGAGARATRTSSGRSATACSSGWRAVRRGDGVDVQLAAPVRLAHDSGRAAGAALEGRSCRRDRSSDGRRARFTYNHAGALVAVDNATSPETYDVDDAGRILSITDADGVRTVAMAYDARRTCRRADLGDRVHHPLRLRRRPAHDAVRPGLQPAVGVHPRRARAGRDVRHGGRVPLHPAFDEFGRVVSQRDPDGRSFTLVDSADRRAAQRGGPLVERRRRALRLRRPRPPRPPGRPTRRRRRSPTTATRCFRSRIDVAGDRGLAVELDWRDGMPSRIVDSDGVVDAPRDPARRDDRRRHERCRRHEPLRRRRRPGRSSPSTIPTAGSCATSATTAGRVHAVVNPAGDAARSATPRPGRIRACIDADGAVTSVDYDSAGLPARIVAADGVGHRRAVRRQAADRRCAVRQRRHGRPELDEFGRQIAVDVNDDRWVTARDAAGRIVKRDRPDRRGARPGVRRPRRLDADHRRRRAFLADGARPRRSRAHADDTRRRGSYTAAFKPEGLLATQTTPDRRRGDLHLHLGRVALPRSPTDRRRCATATTPPAGSSAPTPGSGWWTFDLDAAGRIVRRVSPGRA